MKGAIWVNTGTYHEKKIYVGWFIFHFVLSSLSLAFLVYLKVAHLLLRGNCRKPSQRKTRLPILYAMHFLLAYTTYIYICKIYVPFVRKCKMHGHIRQTPTLAGIFKGKSGPILTYRPRVIFFFFLPLSCFGG